MIVIVDYNTGNCGSIHNMLRKIGHASLITSSPRDILAADRLILPGVGTFDHGMTQLTERGLIPVLEEAVLGRRTPILGICLGMQLFTRGSEEGNLEGLGWIDAQTVRFRGELADDSALKVPHMGWNRIRGLRPHVLLDALPENPRFYFVHSYHVACCDTRDALATTHHGYGFTSAVARGNIAGVQFHPEKSHQFGMQLFRSFVKDACDAHVESDSLPVAQRRRAG